MSQLPMLPSGGFFAFPFIPPAPQAPDQLQFDITRDAESIRQRIADETDGQIFSIGADAGAVAGKINGTIERRLQAVENAVSSLQNSIILGSQNRSMSLNQPVPRPEDIDMPPIIRDVGPTIDGGLGNSVPEIPEQPQPPDLPDYEPPEVEPGAIEPPPPPPVPPVNPDTGPPDGFPPVPSPQNGGVPSPSGAISTAESTASSAEVPGGSSGPGNSSSPSGSTSNAGEPPQEGNSLCYYYGQDPNRGDYVPIYFCTADSDVTDIGAEGCVCRGMSSERCQEWADYLNGGGTAPIDCRGSPPPPAPDPTPTLPGGPGDFPPPPPPPPPCPPCPETPTVPGGSSSEEASCKACGGCPPPESSWGSAAPTTTPLDTLPGGSLPGGVGNVPITSTRSTSGPISGGIPTQPPPQPTLPGGTQPPPRPTLPGGPGPIPLPGPMPSPGPLPSPGPAPTYPQPTLPGGSLPSGSTPDATAGSASRSWVRIQPWGIASGRNAYWLSECGQRDFWETAHKNAPSKEITEALDKEYWASELLPEMTDIRLQGSE